MILLIDTSQETGTTALAEYGKVLFSEENKIAKEHASWLHTAIRRILGESKKTVHDLEAVAVVAGPGSYTGLRVGMAAAKGFCYALKIPLITQNTLRVMAEAMIPPAEERGALLCPMIDARRDEIFTAIYELESNSDRQPPTANRHPDKLKLLIEPTAMILDKSAFESPLSENRILFFGTGANKWEKITDSPKALFHGQLDMIHAFAMLAQHDFDSKTWADPVYTEPVYLKEFFSY